MQHFDFPKLLFYSVCIIIPLGASLLFGLYSAENRTVVYQTAKYLKTAVVTVANEVFTLTKLHPDHFLQPSRYIGSGVTVNKIPNNTDLILMSGFFKNSNELRLIKRNGDIVARWPIHFSDIFPSPIHLANPPMTDWNIDTHGALALSDGSVVFNFEYGGLVKLDRCANVLWTVDRPTHHSVEKAEAGGFWVPARRFFPKGSSSPYPPFETPFYEDTILKISEDGQVVSEISVPAIFYKNGLEAILTSTGYSFLKGASWDNEIVHLNKVDELHSDIADDFPMFDTGDLALSLRKLNLVMVVDKNTGDLKWLKTGPWLRQHDPEFKQGGTITVFNNNIYKDSFNIGSKKSLASIPRVSNIIEIDPESDKYSIIYGNNSQQKLLSIVRGKHQITADNNILITEFEGGRVFEIDISGNIIWEYINRYSQQEVAEITEARVYPIDYFDVAKWSCL